LDRTYDLKQASSAAAFADAIVAIEGLKVRNMERVAGRIAAMEKNTSSTVLNSNDNGRTVVDIEGIDEEVEKLESERRALSSSPSSSLSSDASSRYMAMRLSSAEADAVSAKKEKRTFHIVDVVLCVVPMACNCGDSKRCVQWNNQKVV